MLSQDVGEPEKEVKREDETQTHAPLSLNSGPFAAASAILATQKMAHTDTHRHTHKAEKEDRAKSSEREGGRGKGD